MRSINARASVSSRWAQPNLMKKTDSNKKWVQNKSIIVYSLRNRKNIFQNKHKPDNKTFSLLVAWVYAIYLLDRTMPDFRSKGTRYSVWEEGFTRIARRLFPLWKKSEWLIVSVIKVSNRPKMNKLKYSRESHPSYRYVQNSFTWIKSQSFFEEKGICNHVPFELCLIEHLVLLK